MKRGRSLIDVRDRKKEDKHIFIWHVGDEISLRRQGGDELWSSDFN